ncbi:hypothetical protein JCM3775_001151 [Rhodotorula graminis]|uniref:Uncharacterized protein n=1 Tax=Rhodotorula graminis (strain WP1) TaxID=578459 RepID=A0A0P9EQS7_RHOGW|nr:uncharacterized protein RHOBADRAFT_47521 [Rhodotorula graminis WP1]KPV71817.1 hypothetical protein RHOBADRAFT_47521 [Rhodotorula graminis WP1]
MPASYSSLPEEVISHIADMVHAQDGAFDQLALKRGTTSLQASSIGKKRAIEDEDATNPLEGRWSPVYGRGIRALVQLDRRTRSHALKHLYKTITAKQAASDFCRYAVLGEQVGSLVREVDLDLDPSHDTDPFSLACALRKLKNLSSIIVDGAALELAFPHVFPPEREPDEADKLLGLGILDALGRVKSLTALSVDDKVLACALSGTRSATLSRLSIDNSSSLVPLDDQLVAALNGLQSLVELNVGDMSSPLWLSMEQRVRLEHVKKLTVGRAGVEAYYHEVLLLAHHITPQARTLCIVFTLSESALDLALPEPLLPTLRVLDIQHAQDEFAACHESRLSALEHLHIAFDCPVSVFPYKVDYLPPAPTALRRITLSYPSLKRLTPPAALLACCTFLNIHLSVHRRLASPEAFTASRVVTVGAGEQAANVVAPSRSQALALEETLTWARNRARWLRETGDGPGLQELAVAAVRLRERHLLHES